ncbi:hypothetical protein N8504_03030 [Akkermansiaceae bacterium]|nr:hypothetical protein [Akkermansiaceae bacterium]
MSDFFEDFSDRIEDDAGGFAVMGGLSALSNQRASLKKLSGIQEQLEKAQAASEKTEKKRLAIEKKRLELQQAQIEEQKFTAESVKELRILMADADTLLERMSQMAAAPSGGGDAYDLDLTRTAALIQVKLELVEKNSEVLSDLADLKEQRRLKSHFEKQLSESATLRHLPENPLSFVEKEVFDQLPDIASVFGVLGELSSEQEPLSEGNRKLALGGGSDGYMVSEEELLSRKRGLTEAITKLQTIDQAKIQSGVAGKFTKNHFEEMKGLWGQFYFLKDKEPNYDFSVAVDYLQRLVEESQFKVETEGIGVDALAAIESHIACARDQSVMLKDAWTRMIQGDFDLARSAEKIPNSQRYTNPLFLKNQKRLVVIDRYQDCFVPTIDLAVVDLDSASERIKRAWDELGVTNWPDDSELKQRISKNEKAVLGRISKEKLKGVIFAAGAFVIILALVVFFVIQQQEAERQAAQEAEAAERQAAQEAEAAERQAAQAAEAARKARILELGPIRDSLLNTLLGEGGGKVVSWGRNPLKQAKQLSVPTDLTGVTGIAAGFAHSLALKNEGTVVAWGSNSDKQCDVPTDLKDVVEIAAGSYHSLALKADGSVVAWGFNFKKQRDVPIGLKDVVGIAAGRSHSLALKKDGTVVAWGDNDRKQCDVPTGLKDVVEIAAGSYHSLALKADGSVVAWGYNLNKQRDVPTGLKDVVGIAAGYAHGLALKKDGTCVAWGYNGDKQCDVPTGLKDAVGIAAGGSHSLALKKDRTVVSWGSNESNQLNIPTDLAYVMDFTAGSFHSLVIIKGNSD